jgi:hypothetical protein
MLEFAYEYKDGINQITSIRKMKLRQYEIEEDEWEIIKELRDLLKVSNKCGSYCQVTESIPLYADF